MQLPANQTKIVCTIGPASAAPEVLGAMLRAGMNVARLNFSHGDFTGHAQAIRDLRKASEGTGMPVAVLADLPGPKLRIGDIAGDAAELQQGDEFVLTACPCLGNASRASVSHPGLSDRLRPGHRLYINDGLVELEVRAVRGGDLICTVLAGGEVRSGKGLNVPDIDLGIPAFTERDRECLAFAVSQGVDAVSQSFVETSGDVQAVREAARALGADPFIVAKIERSMALQRIEEILGAADGIMIARGDLGVEIPIERMAGVQKDLMRRANLAGKPVITATQMLESMTHSRLPTRAEATDVANAILDGTDGVMLSGESAVGRYPVEAVAMLARIAADIEERRPSQPARQALERCEGADPAALNDLIAMSVEAAFQRMSPAAVVVWTRTGATARSITRLRLPVWILALTPDRVTCRKLQFSYGVCAVEQSEQPRDLRPHLEGLLARYGIRAGVVVVAEGPSPDCPDVPSRMGVIDLTGATTA
jgi:pyruvate kinase